MSNLDTLRAARSTLTFTAPFFASLAFLLDLKVGAKTSIDGKTLTVTEAAPLNHGDAEILLARASAHCALAHPYRRNGRQKERWDRACTLAVDIILEDSGFAVPADKRWQGMTAEAIYDRLPPDPPSGGGGDGEDGAGPIEVADGEGDGDGGEAVQWAAATIAAAQQAGQVSGEIARLVDALTRPRQDWRTILRDMADPTGGRDYAWTRPARRFISTGLFLPGWSVTTPGPLRVLVDASGSISDTELTGVLAEVQAILDEIRPEFVEVVAFDTRIRKTARFEPGDTIPATSIKAGGGTSYAALFPPADVEWTGHVVITDGFCRSFPRSWPAAPIVWLITGAKRDVRFHAPRGRVVLGD